MRTATLFRGPSTNEGTFGVLTTPEGFHCVTLELPDRANSTGRSCIQKGTYPCNRRWSEAHKRDVYHVDKTPGRSNIEIHSANLAGDVDMGYVSQLLGCIALGSARATFPAGIHPAGKLDQCGVTASVITVAAFEKHMDNQDFMLSIA